MNDYIEMEKKLNEYPTSCITFHDQDICNLIFINNKLYIRFCIGEFVDNLGLLEDDKHFALIDVVYTDIEIKKIEFGENFHIIGSTVYDLTENENGEIELIIFDGEVPATFVFSYKKYKWDVFKIITDDEYYKYLKEVKEGKSYWVKIGKNRSCRVGPLLGWFKGEEFDYLENAEFEE